MLRWTHLLTGLMLWGLIGAASAETVEAVEPVVSGALASGGLLGPAIRTSLSLVAVLAVLGACAWFVQRMRNGGHLKGGLIEIVSGVSLGNREKVVLLRIGEEQIVVGISPSGMTSLHVISGESAKQAFSNYMEQAE